MENLMLTEIITQTSLPGLAVKILLNAVALFLASYIFRRVEVEDFGGALLVALVLAILNATLGAILDLLAFPLRILTFGLFNFVIDALVLLVAARFVKGFRIKGFWNALGVVLLMVVVNTILGTMAM